MVGGRIDGSMDHVCLYEHQGHGGLVTCCTLSKDNKHSLISLSSPITRLSSFALYNNGDIERETMKGYAKDLRFDLAVQAVPPRR